MARIVHSYFFQIRTNKLLNFISATPLMYRFDTGLTVRLVL